MLHSASKEASADQQELAAGNALSQVLASSQTNAARLLTLKAAISVDRLAAGVVLAAVSASVRLG